MVDLNNRLEEVRMKKHPIGFIISMCFAISFLMTAIVSVLDPVPALEMVQNNPFFSWMNPIAGYAVHILGNIFFAAIAIFLAMKSLDYWR